ncbi:PDZ domain-containing protein [Terriglobus roseus]|uniref:PDZ domain-containing protein n=1 Tax=Terriglobus roseus TaxID=392734 RepID=A0A1G7MUA8_9BACT|nr:PDZ domain-containing protein [Terriglobus roseus]SDF65334.1 PDZ domain-containing protein [Terriglobus roseus]
MAFSNLAAAAISLTLLVAPVAQAQEVLVCSLEAPPMYGAGAGGHNTPVQGYLGIMFHDVSDSTYNSQHLRDKRGAEIVMVDHDGPAGKAGLREHDVVLSLNGTTVEGEEQLRKLLHDMQPGRTISISVWRDGTERSLSATLSTREEVDKQARLQRWTVPNPDETTASTEPAPPPPAPKSNSVFSHSFMSSHLLPMMPVYTGATVDTMGPQLADYFGVKDGNGLLVHAVEGNSPAAAAGLHAGDVITRMNGNRVNTEKDWTRALHEGKGKPITMIVVRDRREQTLTMVPDGKKRSEVSEPKIGPDNEPMLMMP